jgi:hypothetical protein
MVNDPKPRKAANEFPSTNHRTVQAGRDDPGTGRRAVGVDPAFIGRLERGQRGAHWRTIRRILVAVDASASDFAGELDAAENSRRRG